MVKNRFVVEVADTHTLKAAITQISSFLLALKLSSKLRVNSARVQEGMDRGKRLPCYV